MFACIISACNSQQLVQDVSPEVFQELLENEVILLDVRTSNEIAQGFIKDASPLDFYDADFERKLGLIQSDKPILVYCKSGGRSSSAAKMLTEMGHQEVYNLEGGFLAWSRTDAPIETQGIPPTKKTASRSEKAFQTLLEDHEFVLLNFSTEWCLPCRKMVPVLSSLESDLASKIKFSSIDMDRNPDIAEKFQVRSIPTILVLKDGLELYRSVGFVEYDDLNAQLNEILEAY